MSLRRRLACLLTAAAVATGLVTVSTQSAEAAPASGTAATVQDAEAVPCGQDQELLDRLSLRTGELTGLQSVRNTTASTILTPTIGAPTEDAPFCEVEISLTHGVEGGLGPDDVNVWVWLPEEWNGRVQAIGGGGTQATNGPSAMRPALAAGYAVIASDSGVTPASQPNIFIASQNRFNWQIFENWTYRGVKESTELGKQLVAAHYGTAAAYTYWNGCSNGGRQGLEIAQREPELFDGVLAAAPAIYGADRLNMTMSWPAMVQNDALGEFLPSCKLAKMTEAVTTYCDGDDGVRDGLVSTPQSCDYTAALDTLVGQKLSCGTVTQQDARIAIQIFQGPRTPAGDQVWYGYTPGMNLAGGVIRSGPSFALQNFAFADTSIDWKKFSTVDLVTSLRQRLQGRLELLASADPALEPYRRKGGKLLMWHGLADGVFPADQSVHYYDEVAKLSGSSTDDFFRLFLAPGVDHCAGGTGPAPTAALDALVDWVEKGEAPEVLSARTTQNGVVTERNLCRYPQVQRYDGGPVTEANSFGCDSAVQPLSPVSTAVKAEPVTGEAGNPVTARVTVTAADGEARGMVDAIVGTAVVASAQVADGVAELVLPGSLPVSATSVTFRYRGYGSHAAAQETVALKLSKRATITKLSSPATLVFGKAGTATVTVKGAASGAVTLTGAGRPQTRPIDALGRATFSLPRSLTGTRVLTASFAGNASTASSTASARLKIRAARTRTTVVVRRKPTPATTGRATITVTNIDRTTTPTGKVTVALTKGTSVRKVQARTLNRNGRVTVVLPSGIRGTWRATFRYAGRDGQFSASTKTLTIRVGD